MMSFPEPGDAAAAAFQLAFKYFRRVEGTFRVNPKAKVESVQVRVYETGSSQPRATHSVALLTQREKKVFNKTSKPQNRIDSLIGATTRIEGNVIFSGGLRVDGMVRGNVAALPDQPARWWCPRTRASTAKCRPRISW